MVGFHMYRCCSCLMFAAMNEGVEVALEVEYCWKLIHRSPEHGRGDFAFQSPETFPLDLHATPASANTPLPNKGRVAGCLGDADERHTSPLNGGKARAGIKFLPQSPPMMVGLR